MTDAPTRERSRSGSSSSTPPKGPETPTPSPVWGTGSPRGVADPTATEARPAPLQQLKTSAQTLLTALIDKAAGVALNKVDELTDKLNEVTANGGVGLTAALAGGQAYLQGNNPLWAAAKAGFSALSAWAKAGLILALVLAAVLGLVLVAVLLLALIVWAIIAAIRAAAR